MSSGGPPGSEDEALGIVEAGEAIGIPTATLLLQGIAMTLAQPRGVARETRFCTLTASRSGLVPCLKKTVIEAEPSLPAEETI